MKDLEINMKFKVIVAVEGKFAEIDNNPTTKSKIMRSYELDTKDEEAARLIAFHLRNNLFEEAQLIGEITNKFDPHIQKM